MPLEKEEGQHLAGAPAGRSVHCDAVQGDHKRSKHSRAEYSAELAAHTRPLIARLIARCLVLMHALATLPLSMVIIVSAALLRLSGDPHTYVMDGAGRSELVGQRCHVSANGQGAALGRGPMCTQRPYVKHLDARFSLSLSLPAATSPDRGQQGACQVRRPIREDTPLS